MSFVLLALLYMYMYMYNYTCAFIMANIALQLKEWKHLQEEAAKRDHRKIGRVSGAWLAGQDGCLT